MIVIASREFTTIEWRGR